MAQHHYYSIREIENLIPFERDIYLDMIVAYLAEVEEENKKQQHG